MNMIDLTPIAQALVALTAALISVVVVPWLRVKFDAEEMAEFLRWVEIGVAAAEQLYCRPVADVRIYSFALGDDFSVF